MLLANYSFSRHIDLFYMYKQNLALNSPQVLTFHKNTTNQPISGLNRSVGKLFDKMFVGKDS